MGSVMIWGNYDGSKARTVSFSDFKILLSGSEICEAWVPLVWRWHLCALVLWGWLWVGLTVACGTPGHPRWASFGGAEWGVRDELSQEAPAHKACVGHSRWARHPGVCPQGQGPSGTDSPRSFCGGRGTGRVAGSGAAWSLQVALRVTWLTCVSQFPGKLRLLCTGDQGYFRFPRVSAAVTASDSSLISSSSNAPIHKGLDFSTEDFRKKKGLRE